MSHFALVKNGIVIRVNVAEQDVIDSGLFGDPKSFIQTSYNTRGNVHYGSDGMPDGGIALRGNFALPGYNYDKENDVFYAPQPYYSWILNQDTWLWEAPIKQPSENTFPNDIVEHTFIFSWNEKKIRWEYLACPNDLSLPDILFVWNKDLLKWEIE